jgi:hypothetical protein
MISGSSAASGATRDALMILGLFSIRYNRASQEGLVRSLPIV